MGVARGVYEITFDGCLLRSLAEWGGVVLVSRCTPLMKEAGQTTAAKKPWHIEYLAERRST